MTTEPDTVLLSVLAAAGVSALTVALLAASAHGKRRERQAWLRGDLTRAVVTPPADPAHRAAFAAVRAGGGR